MKGPFDEHNAAFYLLLGHSKTSLCVCMCVCVCTDEIAPCKLASELVL